MCSHWMDGVGNMGPVQRARHTYGIIPSRPEAWSLCPGAKQTLLWSMLMEKGYRHHPHFPWSSCRPLLHLCRCSHPCLATSEMSALWFSVMPGPSLLGKAWHFVSRCDAVAVFAGYPKPLLSPAQTALSPGLHGHEAALQLPELDLSS